MENFYNSILQPSFAPPSWLFGPVWTILYILIAISFGYVVVQIFRGNKNFSKSLLWPLGINLVTNIMWTPLFFRVQNFDLALIDILVVWGTIVWIIVVFWNKLRWISILQIPYLLWVSFASVLMFGVWWLN